MRTLVPLHITLVAPPEGVLFCLEDRKHVKSAHVLSTGADLTFQLHLEIEENGAIQGPFSMGPPKQRFVYVCSGSCAGQLGSCWTRRAKIQLSSIPKNIPAGATLQARIAGRAKDGGPACATVPLLDNGWRIIRS